MVDAVIRHGDILIVAAIVFVVFGPGRLPRRIALLGPGARTRSVNSTVETTPFEREPAEHELRHGA